MDKTSILVRIKEIAAGAARKNGVEFVHAELGGTKRTPSVRIFIDNVTGISVDDCALVSRDIEAELDSNDLIPSKYVLEVSSPGLERELYSLQDFQRFTGKLAKVKTREAVNGKTNFAGMIEAVEDSTILFTDSTIGQIRINVADIIKANLKIDLEAELKGR
ncbi:MAG: ribosome maturation factor RimP [Pyrinomonadaceae bacterium]